MCSSCSSCDCRDREFRIVVEAPDRDLMRKILKKIIRMEGLMATEAEQINAVSAKFDDLAADVRAALAAITADAQTQLGPDGQAALDALTQKIDSLDSEIEQDETPSAEVAEPTS